MIDAIDQAVFSWFPSYTIVFAPDSDTADYLFNRKKQELADQGTSIYWPYLRIWRTNISKRSISPAMYREGGVAGYTDSTKETIRMIKALPVIVSYEIEASATKVKEANQVIREVLFDIHNPRANTIQVDVDGTIVDLPLYGMLGEQHSFNITTKGEVRETGHVYRYTMSFDVGSFLVLADTVKSVLQPIVNVIVNYDF